MIGIVGLWHLGSVLTAAWLKMGKSVVGIDFDPKNVENLSKGIPPLYEPHLAEALQEGLSQHTVSFSTDPSHLSSCEFVFLAYDTPVDESDFYDLQILETALDRMAPHLKSGSVLIVSSQVPVGTCEEFTKKLPTGIQIVYSPENLRLGEAIQNYLNPGHIVIGANTKEASASAATLFSKIQANYLLMDLRSAEMTKHAINSFLAASITFANQLSDACVVAKADFTQVAEAMKHDPRIGQRAYLKAGIGFSGGTLGRDLRILASLDAGSPSFPLFSNLWRYNKKRPETLIHGMRDVLSGFKGKTIGLLGMTYKPGTSTLRRSIPVEMAHALVNQGALVRAYDPKADWAEIPFDQLKIFSDPYTLAEETDCLFLLTEWPEFKELDFQKLGQLMKEKRMFDPHRFLKAFYPTLKEQGFEIFTSGSV